MMVSGRMGSGTDSESRNGLMALSTRGNGLRTNHRERVSWSMPMAMFMMGTGRMTRPMGTECTFMLMELNMRVTYKIKFKLKVGE